MKLIIALNRMFDFLQWSVTPNGRYLFIIFISILSAIIILPLYKIISNQKKIKYHKNRIFGNLLQMSLYKDKLNVLFQSLLLILKHNVLYIAHSFIPFLIIAIPIILLTIQVNNRCGYQPIEVNRSFIIQADIQAKSIKENTTSILDKIYCTTSPGIIIETPALRIENERKIFWKAKIDKINQSHSSFIRIGIQGNDNFIEKQIVTDHHKRFIPVKAKWSILEGYLNSAEGFFNDDALLDRVTIDYKRASYIFFLWEVDAIILYFIITLIFVFVFKGVFKVRI